MYTQSLQADALGLIAAKVRSALTIDGELTEDGLEALEADNHDVFLALARRLVEPGVAEHPALDEAFASIQQSEAEADDYLVDAGRVDVTTPDSATDQVSLILQGGVAGTGQSKIDRQPDGLASSPLTPVSAPARKIVSFDELVCLVQRLRTRRIIVPSIN
jgi:hypothetical protein